MTPTSGSQWLGHCPACGQTRRDAAGKRAGLRLWRCAQCGLRHSDPQPRGEVEEKYLREYDLAEHFGAWEDRKRVLYERRFEALPAPRAGADRICDVGCADGQFLVLARGRGWAPTGIELNPPAAAKARERGLEVHEGMFEVAEDLPWGRFDLVTAWDCIEHTPQPAAFARRLVRLLAPGGTLALTTLNADALVARVFGMRWSMIVADHYTYWDPGSLRALLEASGLAVERQESFGLGRDFVTWVDALARGRRSGAAVAAPGRSGWDASGAVVRLEALLNMALRRLNAGVGQLVVARPAHHGAG